MKKNEQSPPPGDLFSAYAAYMREIDRIRDGETRLKLACIQDDLERLRTKQIHRAIAIRTMTERRRGIAVARKQKQPQ